MKKIFVLLSIVFSFFIISTNVNAQTTAAKFKVGDRVQTNKLSTARLSLTNTMPAYLGDVDVGVQAAGVSGTVNADSVYFNNNWYSPVVFDTQPQGYVLESDLTTSLVPKPNSDTYSTYDFGGMYSNMNSCPIGYSSVKGFDGGSDIRQRNFYSDLWFCIRKHTPTSVPALDFGGLYTTGYENHTNPFTNNYTCPAGFTSKTVLGVTGDGLRDYNSETILCYRPHQDTAPYYFFGGVMKYGLDIRQGYNVGRFRLSALNFPGTYFYATSTQSVLPILNVTITGEGAGSVTGGLINCTDQSIKCTSVINIGTTVLTAKTDSNYTFTGWSGGGCSGTSTCVVGGSDANITASFTYKTFTNPINGHIYSLTKQMTWQDAEAVAVKRGGHLATIDGIGAELNYYNFSDEERFIYNTFPYPTPHWIGLNNLFSANNFSWSSGDTSSYRYWDVNEPSGELGNGVVDDLYMGARWKDVPSSRLYPGLVEVGELSPSFLVTLTKSGNGIVDGAGFSCYYSNTSTCLRTVANGTSIFIRAVADLGSIFTGWSGACTGTSPTCSFIVNKDTAVTATFNSIAVSTSTPTLTVIKEGNGSGTVSSDSTIYCGNSCSRDFNGTFSTTLTATPSATSTFKGWGFACLSYGLSSTCPLVGLTSSTIVTATFAANSTTTGSVSIKPVNANLAPMSGIYGSLDSGNWILIASTSISFSNLVPGSGSHTAYVKPLIGYDTYAGFCFSSGIECMPLTHMYTKINCSTNCSMQVNVYPGYTTNVVFKYVPVSINIPPTVLLAAPSAGSIITTGPVKLTALASSTKEILSVSFKVGGVTISNATRIGTTNIYTGSWNITNVANGPYTIIADVIDASSSYATSLPKNVTVSKIVNPPSESTFNIYLPGTGTGVVSGAGLSCTSTCSKTVANGTSVSLTATPNTGSTFTGWSGACTGTSPTCTFTVNRATPVTATFSLASAVPSTLTVTKIGNGSGIISSDSTIYCGNSCSRDFNGTFSTTLTATPSAGSVFAGWGGACQSSGMSATCPLALMTSSKNVTATFSTSVVNPPANPVVTVLSYDSPRKLTGIYKGGAVLLTVFNFQGGPTPVGPSGSADWQILVHVEKQGGGYSFNADFYPGVPTSAWTTAAVKAGKGISIPADAPSGVYDIVVGLYQGSQTLPLIAGSGVSDRGGNSYLVGTIEIKDAPTASVWSAIRSFFGF